MPQGGVQPCRDTGTPAVQHAHRIPCHSPIRPLEDATRSGENGSWAACLRSGRDGAGRVPTRRGPQFLSRPRPSPSAGRAIPGNLGSLLKRLPSGAQLPAPPQDGPPARRGPAQPQRPHGTWRTWRMTATAASRSNPDAAVLQERLAQDGGKHGDTAAMRWLRTVASPLRRNVRERAPRAAAIAGRSAMRTSCAKAAYRLWTIRGEPVCGTHGSRTNLPQSDSLPDRDSCAAPFRPETPRLSRERAGPRSE